MEWLNYHHLFYFWTVVREGTVSAASRALRLAQPTVSGQIRALEESLGEKLFRRAGRRLEPTEVGRIVYRYADEIFTVGRELQDTVRGRPTGRPLRLLVGVADVVPKLIAYRLIEPALRLPEGVRIVVREDKAERLLAELALHELDLVISDAPIGAAAPIRGFNHLLGECPAALYASPRLASSLRRRFPASLEGAPLLLPAESTGLRRALDLWLDQRGLRPRIAGEFDDSALLKVFGQAGTGAFAAPLAIEGEIRRQFGVRRIAVLPEVRERFYAITAERRMRNPAAVAISEAARKTLFGPAPVSR